MSSSSLRIGDAGNGHHDDGLFKIIAKWLALFLITALLSLAVLEVLLRLLAPNVSILLSVIEQTDDRRGYRLKPHSRTVFQGLHEALPVPVLWEVNGDGMRSDRPSPAPSDRFRVLTYGDSETFGWGVAIEGTIQRLMESSADVEVLNLGVPGYNAEGVAEHMRLTVDDYKPDLMIYFFHKNDFDEPIRLNPILSTSRLYVYFNLTMHLIGEEERKARRRNSEGKKFLSRHVQQMIDLARQKDIPLIVGALHRKYKPAFPQVLQDATDQHLADRPGFSLRLVDLDTPTRGLPKRDRHRTEPAYRTIADLLCQVISGPEAEGCTPPYWYRRDKSASLSVASPPQ